MKQYCVQLPQNTNAAKTITCYNDDDDSYQLGLPKLAIPYPVSFPIDIRANCPHTVNLHTTTTMDTFKDQLSAAICKHEEGMGA